VHADPPSPITRPLGELVLLGSVTWAVGFRGPGVLVCLACGVLVRLVLARGLANRGLQALGPADRVTLTRASLTCGVAGLVANAFWAPARVTTLVSLAAGALLLDAVDGWVARRTGTASPLGARFDMETDAFLILVLSVHVAHVLTWWVIVIGAARYIHLATGWLAPWSHQPVPARYWRKVVAATQGVVLAVAATQLLSDTWTELLLAAALALLATSFGTEVAQLRRGRPAAAGQLRHRAGRSEGAGAPWPPARVVQ
jgi:phosphatidylglycerophosphate synthase